MTEVTVVIELKHLQKVVGQSTLVDIEFLAVAAREVAAVVGPADSGKSELLALLTGQSRPTSGTVRVAGMDPLRERDRLSRQVGVLFVENGLYERLSTRTNLLFHCRLHDLPATRADEVLEQVGLADHASVLASRLPQGLARRLAFGRAILHQPTALLLMQPFAGCDVASTTLLTRLIGELSDAGTAVLILASAATGLTHLGWTVYVMEQGRIVRTDVSQDDRRVELPFKVPARQEGQVTLINPADILYCSAQEGQTSLYTTKGQIPSHLTLNELEERLARNGFFRAHRAYLVNLQRVKVIVPYTRDSFGLILDDPEKTEIPLSKTAARELRELLGY